MHPTIKSVSVSVFFILSIFTSAEAQNSNQFNNDRSIKIKNQFTTSDQISFYFQVQSTSNNLGAYERIFGTTHYSFELADHNGILAFYNGATWYDLGVNIREKEKDIFLILDKRKVSIYDGDKLITTKTYKRKTFNCRNLYIGSTYSTRERLIGQIDYFTIHNRILKRREIAKITKKGIKAIKKTSPDLFYDFTKGMVYEKGLKNSPNKIREDKLEPLVNNNIYAEPVPDSNKPKKASKYTEETVDAFDDYGDAPEPPKRYKKNNFQIQLTYKDNWEYKGKLMSDPKLIGSGQYDLIIKSDGTVIIKLKTIEDKN